MNPRNLLEFPVRHAVERMIARRPDRTAAPHPEENVSVQVISLADGDFAEFRLSGNGNFIRPRPPQIKRPPRENIAVAVADRVSKSAAVETNQLFPVRRDHRP